MNSRDKGKRGEREFAKWLRDNWGVAEARRGVQFSGGPDSPDVVGLPGVHFEVKNTERLNLWDAVEQAKRDCGNNIPIVAHKKNHSEWLLVIRAEDAENFSEIICRLVGRGFALRQDRD